MRSKYVRARHEDGDLVRESLQKLFSNFARLLNGDHRKPRIEHYCHEPGCRGGQQRSIAIRDITALLVEAYFPSLVSICQHRTSGGPLGRIWHAKLAPCWLIACCHVLRSPPSLSRMLTMATRIHSTRWPMRRSSKQLISSQTLKQPPPWGLLQ